MSSPQSTHIATPATPWMTTNDAAGYARCSRDTVIRAIDSGRLRSAHAGPKTRYRIHVDWLDAWITART